MIAPVQNAAWPEAILPSRTTYLPRRGTRITIAIDPACSAPGAKAARQARGPCVIRRASNVQPKVQARRGIVQKGSPTAHKAHVHERKIAPPPARPSL